MSSPAVIIPTVKGRERYLRRVVGAYRLSEPRADIYVLHDHPTCGEAWNAGAAIALAAGHQFLHFGADDLVPEWGWWSAKVRGACRAGVFPGAVLLNEDGTVWNPQEAADGTRLQFPRVPTMTATTWRRLGPVPPIHYMSDIWFGRHGDPTVTCEEFRFTHLWAAEGRHHDSEPDRVVYEEWLARA